MKAFVRPSKVRAALGFSLPQSLYQQYAPHVSTEALLDLESATDADETEIDTTETTPVMLMRPTVEIQAEDERSYAEEATWIVRLGKNARANPSGACGPVGDCCSAGVVVSWTQVQR